MMKPQKISSLIGLSALLLQSFLSPALVIAQELDQTAPSSSQVTMSEATATSSSMTEALLESSQQTEDVLPRESTDEAGSQANDNPSEKPSKVGTQAEEEQAAGHSQIIETEEEENATRSVAESGVAAGSTEGSELQLWKDNIQLKLDTPTAEEVYGSGVVTSTIQFSTTGQTRFVIPNPYIEVVFPATEIKTTAEHETSSYLDSTQVIPVSDSRYLRTEKEVVDGKTIYRIYFSELDSTTKLNLPYAFSFADRITPEGYTVTPTVSLKTTFGEDIATVTDKTYSIKYEDRKVTKYAYDKNEATNARDGVLLDAGIANNNNTNYIDSNRYEYIPFYFVLGRERQSSDERLIKTATITDTLPTYTDVNGKVRTAYFNPAANPGWVDNGDGTVSYTVEHSSKEIGGDLRNDINSKISTVPLNLAFPDAPITENGTPKEYNNHVDIEVTPYNASAQEVKTVSDDLKFKLAANVFDGKGMFGKTPHELTIKHDLYGLYLDRPKYNIKLGNKLSVPLKNIVWTEDAAKYDSRLYIAAIESVFNRVSYTKTIAYTLRAYRADGSYVDQEVKAGQTVQLNTATQEKINAIAKQVQSGAITVDQAEAVEPEFVRYDLIFPADYELKPGDTLDTRVHMAFKDPFNVEYSDKNDILNTASATFDYTSPGGEDRTATLSASANKRFVPLTESLSMGKSVETKNAAYKIGDRINFRIYAENKDLSNGRYLSHPTLVDLLPEGVSFDEQTRVSGFYNSQQYLESYSLEKNYKGTGRDAVVIKIKSGLVGELLGGDSNGPKSLNFFIRNLVINDQIIPTKAETATDNNDNQLFYHFGDEAPDEITSKNKVEDTYDLYEGTNIYKTTAKIPAIVSDSISIEKSIRNTGSSTWTNEIDTDFQEDFDYRLRVKNYFPVAQKSLVLYDRIPYVTSAGKEHANTLSGPVTISAKNQDVTSKYTVYYRNDDAPEDPSAAINSSAWTTDFLADATAIKVVLKDGELLNEYEILDVIVPSKAPAEDAKTYATSLSNAFHAQYDGASVFAKSNSVVNNLPGFPTKPIQVNKVWKGEPQDAIGYAIYKEGDENPVAEGVLDASNNWTEMTEALPVYDETTRQEITYSVKETTDSSGYAVSYSGDQTVGFVITNTKLTTISGKKVWDDANNQDGLRPSQITVHLLADGTKVASQIVTAATNWIYSFEDLPEFKDNQKVNYTVTEEAVDGYTTTIDGNNITNTHTPSTTSVEGTKVWDDKDNQDGVRPSQITINLLADGTPVASKTVTEADGWAYRFTDLPEFKDGQKIVYTVTEDTVEGYSTTIDGTTITNKRTPDETSVTVTKAWDDANNQDGIRPASIQVQLYANGQKQGSAVTLSAADNWTYTWTKLPVNASGKAITYTVKETEVATGYTVSIDDTDRGNMIITNTHTPSTTSVEGTKVWDDKDNQDGVRPSQITVNLLADGTPVASKTVTEADGWAYRFTDLPEFKDGQKIVYTVTEDTVEGYSTTIDGTTIINKRTPDETSVTVTKAWDDANNQDGIRPASIQVQLYANGQKQGSAVTLSAADNWTYTWTKLPVNVEGKEIVYTVEEIDVPTGYTVTISQVDQGNIIITNTHKPKADLPTPPTTSISTPSEPRILPSTGEETSIVLVFVGILSVVLLGFYSVRKRNM